MTAEPDTINVASMFDAQQEKQETTINVLQAEAEAIERSDSQLCQAEKQIMEEAAKIIEMKVMK